MMPDANAVQSISANHTVNHNSQIKTKAKAQRCSNNVKLYTSVDRHVRIYIQSANNKHRSFINHTVQI